MSDVVWQAAIAAIVTVILAWMADRTKRAAVAAAKEAAESAHNAEESAHKAEVKTDIVSEKLDSTTTRTDKKLDAIAETGDKVHVLVNSNMMNQLKVTAVALRRVFDLTKHPDDGKAADVAEQAFSEHKAKQELIDSGKKIA